MDPLENERVALMSIKPEFAFAILRGEKLVEFRKRPLADDVRFVLIYATLPVQAIVGAFTVIGQEVASPEALWDVFGEIGGIEAADFHDYYQSHSQGIGIKVGTVARTSERLGLEETTGVRVPPQSFQYIRSTAISKLMGQGLLEWGTERVSSGR